MSTSNRSVESTLRPRPAKGARPRSPGAAALPAAPAPEGMNEQAWIEVIQKMDEVYADLLQYEVALEQKNGALEESHRFIASVLAAMSDILVVCNRQGLIEEVNPAFQRFTGRGEEELRGTPIFDLFPDPEARQRARAFFEAPPTERGANQDVELPLLSGGGGTVPVSFNWTPRRSGTGKRIGMVVTGRPVGELRRAYQELHQAHEDLKRTQQQLIQAEKMASLGRLVAGVAHELNNPISFVLGNVLALRRYADRLQTYLGRVHTQPALAADGELEELRRELRIDRILEDMQPLIDGMIEGAERTRDIVDGLKRFSAQDRERDEAFNLTEVVARAVRWVSRSGSAEAPALEVALDLPARLPMKGAPGQLQQVFMNLVQNAADATAGQAAPRLTVRAEVLKDGAEGPAVRLYFQDNGPGIPEEALGHLFDPFFTTKPVGQGTGLGLSISYGIVLRHGGRLCASNGPDGGAVFCLTLPLAGD